MTQKSKSCIECAFCVRVKYTFCGIRGDHYTTHYRESQTVAVCTYNPPGKGGFRLHTELWEHYEPQSIKRYFGYPRVGNSAPCGQFKKEEQ